jgi:hypothetical protein
MRNTSNRCSSDDNQSQNANQDEMDNEYSLTLRVFQNTKKEEDDGMQHLMQLETFKCRFNEGIFF